MLRKLACVSLVSLGACAAAPIEKQDFADQVHYRVESKARLPFQKVVAAAQPRADATCAQRGKMARWVVSSQSESTPGTRVVFVCQ